MQSQKRDRKHNQDQRYRYQEESKTLRLRGGSLLSIIAITAGEILFGQIQPEHRSETGNYHDHFQRARQSPPVIRQQIIPNDPKGLRQKTHLVIVKDQDMLDEKQRCKEAKDQGQGKRNPELK